MEPRSCSQKRLRRLFDERSRCGRLCTLVISALALGRVSAAPRVAANLPPTCRVIVDAGSASSRFFLFQDIYNNAAIEIFDNFTELTPGLSDQLPEDVYGAYIKPGFQEVADFMTSGKSPLEPSTCSVHVLATGGMRLLPPERQDEKPRPMMKQALAEFRPYLMT